MGKHRAAGGTGYLQVATSRRERRRRLAGELTLIAMEVAELRMELADARAELSLNRRAIAMAYRYAGHEPPAEFIDRHLYAIDGGLRDEAG